MKKHAADKIIVFSESIVALQYFAEAYGRPYLCGDTSMLEREAAIRCDCTSITTLSCLLDKTLEFVFSDCGFTYAVLYRSFRDGNVINTLFLSKVGDVALDVPDANVLIQVRPCTRG